MRTVSPQPWRPVEPHEPTVNDEVLKLRRTVRDLVALSALPSIWVDSEIQRSLQNVTDVLRAAMRAFTVCVRLHLPDGTRFETGSAEGLSKAAPLKQEVIELLDLVWEEESSLVEIPQFNGSAPFHALPHPIYSEGRRIGCFVAFYRADLFPDESDRLLLQVSANQVTLLLQRHQDQEERFARRLAEERLRQAEHQYEQLVQALPAAVYTCDTAGRITMYNEAAAKLWGLRPKIGEDKWCGSYKIFNPDGSPLPLEDCPMAIAIREGRSVRGQEILVERPNGTRVLVLPHPDPIRDESGAIIGTVNMLVEIQALKEAEQAARASGSHLQTLLNLMPAAVYACDAKGRITFYNRRAAELWGREPKLNDESQKFCAVYRCWFGDKILKPEETPMEVAVREGKSFRNLEPVFERPDGVKIPVLVNIDPLFDARGKPAGAINVFQDITALKQAERTLREREERYELVVNGAEAAIWDWDVINKSVLFSPRWKELRGLGDDDEISDREEEWLTRIHPEDAPRVQAAVKAYFEGRTKSFSEEYRVRRKDGQWIWVLDRGIARRDAAGTVIRMAGSETDITERKRAETALRGSKALLESQKDAFQEAMRGSSLEESLAVLVRRVIEATEGRARAGFYIASPDRTTLRHIVGMPEHYANAVDGFSVGSESLACGLAIHTGQPEIAVDVELEPKWEPYRWLARHHNFRACWSIPLRTKNSAANGTLAMYFEEPSAPTPQEMELATVIAHAATVIISRHQQSAERERAEQAMRKRGERLQLLADTLGQLISARDPETIVRELFPKVAAHLGVDTYFNFMVDPSGDALRLHSCAGIPEDTARQIGRLEFGQAICGTVAQTRQGIHATDIQHSGYDKAQLVRGFGIQCYACNPLMVGERLLGTLSFASRTRIAFDEDELQFLRIISQYTAVALDRLQGADRLKESEERFRAVLDNSTTVIYLKDLEGRYLLTNERHAKLFHLSKDQALGKTDEDIFPSVLAAKFRENDLAVLREGQALEFEEVAPTDDGPHTYISVKFPLRKADGTIYAVAGISTDITERRKVEDALRRSEKLFRELADSMPQMVWAAQPGGHVDYYNKRWYEYTGFPERYGDESWTPVLHPDDVERTRQTYTECIRDERIYQIEYRLKDRETGSYRWFLGRALPIRDESGKVIRWFGTCTDIDDQKRAEEMLENVVTDRTAQLRDTVAELEAFSYSIAHDMRAPLRAMQSFSTLLNDECSADISSEGKNYLRRITTSAGRMDRLIQDVLTYSRVTRSDIELIPVDLDALVGGILESYPQFQPPDVIVEIQSPLSTVIGNEASLTQCFSNLLGNAAKFVLAGVVPKIVVRTEQRGACLRVWIEDNGIGIPSDQHEKIFGMFQRLQSDFDGTGIGLAIVKKAVERMGGTMGLESTPQQGSKFWFELPIVEKK